MMADVGSEALENKIRALEEELQALRLKRTLLGGTKQGAVTKPASLAVGAPGIYSIWATNDIIQSWITWAAVSEASVCIGRRSWRTGLPCSVVSCRRWDWYMVAYAVTDM